METVLLTVVEADDNKNQRRVNYFSTFIIKKNKQINKRNILLVTDANNHFPVVKLFQWQFCFIGLTSVW